MADAQQSLVFIPWPAPVRVKACYTLRTGGYSLPPFDGFNLANHVGDQQQAVNSNRQNLQALINQQAICWLKQVHGVGVVPATNPIVEADANYTRQSHQVCCVMTADCLPVFFCDTNGDQVAIAHAGWRGLCAGILQRTLATFAAAESVMAYLGPAISQSAFEVGDDVRDSFIQQYPHLPMETHFIRSSLPQKWMADLYGIAKTLLNNMGVNDVYGGDRCTFSEARDFFSYRRDGKTGRMANLIWLENE